MIETSMSAYQLADEAIGIFLEYRDVHGWGETEARQKAASEVQQGVNAEIELHQDTNTDDAAYWRDVAAENAMEDFGDYNWFDPQGEGG